jgi:hypothetical protein
VGGRANLVIVEDGRVELYYSHWVASTLLWDLCRGPQEGLALIRSQHRCDADDSDAWLDSRWCEGAAIVDLDRRLVAVAGCEEGLGERRLMFELYRVTWPGWQVAWLPETISSVFGRLGLDRARCWTWENERSGRDLDPLQYWWTGFPDPPYVTSALVDGQLRWWGHNLSLDHVLLVDPATLADLDSGSHPPTVGNAEPTIGGTHIDFDASTISFWHSMSFRGDAARLVELLWPGFRLQRWCDDFSRHNAVFGEDLISVPLNRSALRADLERRLLRPPDSNRAATSAAALAERGHDIALTPATELHVPVTPDLQSDEHLAVFDEILAQDGLPGPVPVVGPDGEVIFPGDGRNGWLSTDLREG